MGGLGSGVKWEKKGTVEDHRRLDIREIRREHEIKPGDWMTVKFEWRGEQMAQEVHVDWTACNYGGHRPWLICMGCGRKVGKLFLRGKNFACRHCHDLTYTSCQEADSRVSKFLENYDGFDETEDLPFYAVKGLIGRMMKRREQLKKLMARRRRGRPTKKECEG